MGTSRFSLLILLFLTSRNRIPRSNLLGTSTPRMQRTLSRAGQLLGLFLCSVEVLWPTSPRFSPRFPPAPPKPNSLPPFTLPRSPSTSDRFSRSSDILNQVRPRFLKTTSPRSSWSTPVVPHRVLVTSISNTLLSKSGKPQTKLSCHIFLVLSIPPIPRPSRSVPHFTTAMFVVSWVITVLHGRPRFPNVFLSQDALLLLIACLGLQWGSVSVHISFIL